MKKEIHPENYRPVIFEDLTSGKRFLIASASEFAAPTLPLSNAGAGVDPVAQSKAFIRKQRRRKGLEP